MEIKETFGLMARHTDDVIVVCALGMSANEWWQVTGSEDTFYMHGAMGFASSFALGLAVAMPDKQVWIIDGDGSLCMNLGTLLTASGQGPANLKHFVLNNGVYQTVGGVPMTGASRSSYTAIAAGAGVERCYTADSMNALSAVLADIKKPGHCFIDLQVERDDGPILAPPQPFEGPEMKYRFGRAMERRFGIEVFGPEGY
ncbi:thiamine pyrophosphate-dependent enzyme [Cucumibacter marinus]|uniref:thiamine pyrophosphate-dependent enzyme n=1 Tax=Cucumibacter marinus TaxID=1121252 RepID=UPI00040D6240|nr:thiamine pyrophosphate-dependent enzyme [Cucumibacter marinus]